MQVSVAPESVIDDARRLFMRVFVPVDYSVDSHRAVGAALEMRRVYGSAVCLFHVQSSDGTDDFLGGIGSPAIRGDWVVEAKERLGRFVSNVVPNAIGRVELHACIGSESAAVEHIREEAKRWRASLIVLSANVHSRFFRSPAERIVHDVDTAVLVIPR